MERKDLDRYKRVLLEKWGEMSVTSAEPESPIPAAGGQPGDPVDKLGRVGRASANDSEFHPNAFTSAPDWATWQAASWPSAMGNSSGVMLWQTSTAIGQRHRNRQPSVGSMTRGAARSVSTVVFPDFHLAISRVPRPLSARP